MIVRPPRYHGRRGCWASLRRRPVVHPEKDNIIAMRWAPKYPMRVHARVNWKHEPGVRCLKSLDRLKVKSATAALWRLDVWPSLLSIPLKRQTFLKSSKGQP
jgi:hypothetical protein